MLKEKLQFCRRIASAFIVLFFMFFIQKSYTQCAGEDKTITICDKETNPAFQTFNLFDQLDSPATGGEWTSGSRININTIDSTTGIVNLWEITTSGIHTFTYTNDSCGDSATVTIELGSYPGEDNIDGGANACSDNYDVPVFSFLDNENDDINADINGIWTGDAISDQFLHSGDLIRTTDDHLFNAVDAGPGTYTLTYTTPAVASCATKTTSVILEVHRAPNPGIATDFLICTDDDLSLYKNIELFEYLEDEDNNGEWTENSGTSQLSNDFDTIIDIEEIYNNFGAGTYSFSYTVFAQHRICEEKTSTINIIIEEITGEIIADIVCNSISSFEIDYTESSTYDFMHDMVYEIRNVVTNDFICSNTIQNTYPGFPDTFPSSQGTSTITLPSSDVITAPGVYNISITEISNVNGIICESLSIDAGSILLYTPEINITETCFDTNTIANLDITTITNPDGTDINATQSLTYNVTYSANYFDLATLSNSSHQETITFQNDINFTDGNGIIPIDFSEFNFAQLNDFFITSATMNINFTNDDDTAFECISYTFPVNLTPTQIKLSSVTDNECDATEMAVVIDAPTILTGSYTITYDVLEVGSSDVLIENTVNLIGGEANYNVDISGLEEGNYRVLLKSIQDDTTPCRTQFEFEIEEFFSIAGIPDTPTLNDTQSFCFADYDSTTGPTIDDITVDTGENLTWYASLTATASLTLTEPLIDGEDYYVTAEDASNTCDASPRAMVTVEVLKTDLVLGNATQTFCAIDNPTLSSITATAINGGDLVWFDSNSGGNELADTTTITDGVSYYALERNGTCEGELSEFTVSIISPTITITDNTYCASPSETITAIQNLASTDNTYELVWYDDNNTVITDFTLLLSQDTYFVTSKDPVSGCESAKNPITVYITSPVSGDTQTYFCIDDNSTLANLDAKALNEGQIVWYDSLTNGSTLPGTTQIISGTSYFAAEQNGTCESNRTEYKPTIITPSIPEVDSKICVTRDINASLTLADIETHVTPDSDTSLELVWYDNFNQISPLPNTTGISQQDLYYVSYIHPLSGCESDVTSVLINIISNITSENENPTFCSSDNATLADLDAITHNEGTLVWYDSNNDELTTNVLLENGSSYFAAERFDTCESNKLEFNVTIIEPSTPVNSGSNTFCASATDTISSLESIISTESNLTLVWYDAPSGGTILDTTDLLTQNTTYYVASAFNDSNTFLCESDRIAIQVEITAPVTGSTTATFCSSDSATLADLDTEVHSNGSLVWYNNNGTEITTNEILATGSYFATERFNNCESIPVEYTITIINTPTPINSTANSICVDEGNSIAYLESFITPTPGFDLIWYDENDVEITDTSATLTNNTTYKAANRFDDGTYVCESESISISVTIISTVSTDDVNLIFCSSDAATLADIAVIAPNNRALVWYTNLLATDVLDANTLLVDGTTYYVSEEIQQCGYVEPLAITVTVISPDTPTFEGETELCSLDEPTIETLADSTTITDPYTLIWYDAEEDGNELDLTEPLEDKTSYFVAGLDEVSGCESERIEITISLSNCSPDVYEFFVPDGFSPNNDGTNDVFFIPNIEYYYPDYEYEIFNRYGQSLFKGNIDNPNWDGTNNASSKESTSGVYYYILKYNRYDLKPEQGRIYLSK